ncbi:MAG TPA: hypothetical protein VGF66_07920 [Gaiellaceae bacterium]|jgi:hypothetical protein
MDWIPFVRERQSRFADQHGELDERSLVRKGNVAYAAGLGLLMLGDPDAATWLGRAAATWRESWQGGESWGRPIGAIKASLLAGDDHAAGEYARWALEAGAERSESPIGRYAAALASLVLERWPDARRAADSLRERDNFPRDVADALAYISAHDVVGYVEALESVVESFETRTEYLEDARVADTALVLDLLARRRGIEVDLPESDLLP